MTTKYWREAIIFVILQQKSDKNETNSSYLIGIMRLYERDGAK
jgi:hypothetical protein